MRISAYNPFKCTCMSVNQTEPGVPENLPDIACMHCNSKKNAAKFLWHSSYIIMIILVPVKSSCTFELMYVLKVTEWETLLHSLPSPEYMAWFLDTQKTMWERLRIFCTWLLWNYFRLVVAEDGVKAVYKLSQDLRIHSATEACSRHLISSLTPDNCLGIKTINPSVSVRHSYFPLMFDLWS